MKTYKIKQSSQLLFIATLIILGVGGMYILISLTNSLPKISLFLCIGAIFCCAYFMARYLSTAEIEMIMDNDGIKKKWVKQFLFKH
jgi:hypothetical protein